MSAPRSDDVHSIAEEALDLAREERSAFLAQRCAGNETLRRAVEDAVSAEDRAAQGFLVPPVPGAVYQFLAQAPDVGPAGGRIGRYRLTRAIASGGIGTVYLAEPDDGGEGPPVAVKLIRRGMASEEILRRFRTERQVLAVLSHPNIARFLQGGVTEDGVPYLVMEYVHGVPIDRHCDDKRLTLRDRLKLFREVCSAVQFAHQNLVVHRDMKPGNILVTDEGAPKLLDFGIAKLLEPEGGARVDPTVTLHRFVTPQYASPEQINGAPISTATDVYSLGVVLYELLTGHRPYEVRNVPQKEVERLITEVEPQNPSTKVTQTIELPRGDGTTTRITPQIVSAARATDPTRLRRELSGDLDTIVMKALHKDPARRYASVEQLSEDVRRYLEGLPVTARRDTFLYRSTKLLLRHKAIGIAICVALLGAATATIGVWIGLRRAESALLETQTQFRNARAEVRRRDAVNHFLIQLLGSAEAHVEGRELTVREALERAASTVAADLKDDPDTLIAVENVISTAYVHLGDLDAAEQMVRRTLERFESDHSLDQALRISTLSILSGVNAGKGDLPEAERVAREAVELAKTAKKTSLRAAEAENALGGALLEERRFEEAELSFRKVAAIQRALHGEDSPEEALALIDVAGVLLESSNLHDAEQVLRRSYDILVRRYGDEQLDAVRALNILGVIRESLGDLNGAESIARRVLTTRNKLLGPRHPESLGAANNLIVVLWRKGSQEEAIRLNRELERSVSEVFGENSLKYASVLKTSSIMLHDRGELVEAETHLSLALDIDRATLGPSHPEVAFDLSSLAYLQEDAGRLEEAESTIREALAIQRVHLPPGHRNTSNSIRTLGSILTKLGRPTEAELCFHECLDMDKALYADDHPYVASASALLGRALMLTKQYDLAEYYLLRAADWHLHHDAPERGDCVQVFQNLAGLAESCGKPLEAVKYRILASDTEAGDASQQSTPTAP